MYTRLLTCADTDRLTVYCVANRIRLSIFKGDECDDKISDRTLGDILILCNDIREQLAVDSEIISSLLEGYTEYLLINGSQSELYWPSDGVEHSGGTDPNVLIITQIEENQ